LLKDHQKHGLALETISGKGEAGIKESGGGDESKYNIFDTL
jgi:hypothetical protein